jgi:iron complex transport system ATP-binding protein
MTEVSLQLTDVRVVLDGQTILDRISWTVRDDERWVVLGANGSGKTTLFRVASMYLHPSSGTIEVLGGMLGRVDVRSHRARIGIVSSGFVDLLRPTIAALDIVMTAKYAALESWWHTYDDADRARAIELLDRFGCAALADHELVTLSSGERQRVQLARSLMADPGLLLLDEPSAGLDLGGREDLLARLTHLAGDPATPPIVLITHHVDEIPAGFTHLVLLKDGQVLRSGPLAATLTADALSECFGLELALEQREGRYFAFATSASNRGRERSISSPSRRSSTGPHSPPP